MANTVHAVDWAVQEGANAVELDLQLTANGQPDRFYHGPACDCTCRCPWLFSPLCTNPRFVCTALRIGSPHGGNPCYAESPVTTLLSHTARKSEIALAYIDSKIDDNMDDNIKRQAGRNVIRTLIDWLFGRGYRGNVIIGSFSSRSLSYVKTAVAAASSSCYSSKIFFSVELGSNNNFAGPHAVMRSLPTGNTIFGTGKSSCAPLSPHPPVTLEEARMNKDLGTISMVYTWTDDATSTIQRNLNYVQASPPVCEMYSGGRAGSWPLSTL